MTDETRTVDVSRAAPSPGRQDSDTGIGGGGRLGRYVLLYRLGSGGMGVVYAAYDPELDRKVALKVLRTGEDGDEGRAAVVREAQAMARLVHPNVVTVYDVGSEGSRVFLAMEFVAGRTLRDWVDVERPSWRQCLRVFELAGRGLAAAHAADIVHQDFKPSNVMIKGDGEVRVLDFGIARIGDSSRAGNRLPAPGADGPALSLGSRATGTPGYVAPEQIEAGSIGPAGDQFSFCVALYECLFGRRPFVAEPASSYLQEIEGASLPELVQKRGPCPRWLRQALRRGLARDPAERFPSMDALLAAIAFEPRRRRWLGYTATTAAAIAAVAFLAHGCPSEPRICEGGEERALQVWNPGRRAALKASFAATGVPIAGEAFDRVEGLFDRYARDWATGYREACEATHLLGDQSSDMLDLRMACLDQRRTELGALVELFTAPDATVVSRAPRSAEGLAPLSACADRTELALQPLPPGDEASRAKIAAVRADVASQRARKAVGLGVDAEVARRAVANAQATGYKLLEAQALRLLGLAHEEQGDYKAAEATLQEALWAAMAGGDRVLQLQIHHLLMNLAAYFQGDGAKAEWWARFADAALAPLRLRHRELEAEHANARGLLSRVTKDGQERSHFVRAVELSKGLPGIRRAHRIAYLNNLALHSSADEGIALLEQSLELTEVDGRASPLLVMPLVNLASHLAAGGRYHSALAHAERALEIHEGFFGEGHRDQVYPLLSLGQIHVRLDQPDEAFAYLEQASALAAQTWSERHELVVLIEQALGEVALQRDDLSAAARHLAASEAAVPAAYPSSHPLQSSVRASRCQLELRREAWPRLLELAEEAWTVGEEQGWGEERDRWLVLIALGRARLGSGRTREAVEPLERAVEMVPPDFAPSLAAEARQGLAEALLASHPGRAVRLAREAIALLGGDNAVRRRRQQDLRHWLGQLEGIESLDVSRGQSPGVSAPRLGSVPLDSATQGAS